MANAARASRQRRAEVDKTLVKRLEAIASPSRLRLLSTLQEPRQVSEIELVATDEEGAERSITTQGVRHHLNKLRECGFVRVEHVDRGGKRVNRYVADHRRMYELGEVLRSMPLELDAPTDEMGAPPTWEQPPGGVPSLTVVHGAEIGRSFSLTDTPEIDDRGWVIGQAPAVDVALDWDPYVGRQAGEIERDHGSFRLIDLRASARRISVNGQVLERGESCEITDGDLIGVGRSVLWFRE